ncbi:MAG: type VI secretion system contractile sheath small subunit [Gemmataceae bacterium]|nr:type VI secretion system contractile sheath small subunit [Gemmataceae bacterium]
MAESYQEKLKRVRPPRVRIQYEVETEGAMREIELPFVVGVMADLSAMNKQEKSLKQRSFIDIDRDSFNDVMAKAAPRVAFRVPNKVGDNPDEQLNVNLQFSHIDDFEPARIAEQVPVLNDLLQMRKKLNELLGKMEGKDQLEKLLADVLGNTENKQAILDAIAKQSGGPKPE